MEPLTKLLSDSGKMTHLASEAMLKLVAAIAIFYIGKWLAEALLKVFRFGMKRAGVDETLRDFLGHIFYGGLLTLVVVTALTQLGVETTSAAAVLGGAALAIGLSLQNQLSSLAAGVMLILFRPFNKNDTVEVGAITGIVEEITIVNTRLRSADNRELTVPNSAFTTQTIINHSTRPLRRVDLLIGVSYEADLRAAKRVLMEVMLADERTLRQPAPTVEVAALGPHSVDLSVLAWTKTPNHGALKASLLETIKLRFDAEDIGFAQRQVLVQLRETGTQTPAPAALR